MSAHKVSFSAYDAPKVSRSTDETNSVTAGFGRSMQISSIYAGSAGSVTLSDVRIMLIYIAGRWKHRILFRNALFKELDPTWNIKAALIEAGYHKTVLVKLKNFEVCEHFSYINPAIEGVVVRQALANLDPNSTPFIRGDPDKLSEVVYK
ncbi:hypothetical protein F5146DRAFT_994756 [Armillaria mellea]|nr:hypothetical protein F5146DRAFT_994756 [Armillaria mellea]